VESTAKTRRPQPMSNPNNDRIPSTSKSSCLLNNLKKVEEQHRNLLFSKTPNHSSSEGYEERLASPRPSKPRTCLRWLPTERIFDLCGKVNVSSNTDNESNTSLCDNASASNPSPRTYKQRVFEFYFFSWQVYETLEVDYMYPSACYYLMSFKE
nr:hypothetical protein [Tanacetum cinerariifolium]